VKNTAQIVGFAAMLNEVGKSSVVLDREVEKEKSREPSGPRIRCPLCGWSPRKEDLWSCACGNEWNTFETGGVCPACLQQWTETQCLSSQRQSTTTAATIMIALVTEGSLAIR
jgi:hypothetical protein